MNVKYRYPKKLDAKGLMNYINSLVDEDAKIKITEKVALKEEKEWLDGQLKNIRKKKAVIIVAEVDKKIVGVCDVKKNIGRVSHIATLGIGVMKGYRKMGIGTELMKRTINEAKKKMNGIETIHLDVLGPNKPALYLYKKLGFRKVAVVPKWAKIKGKNESKIVMYLKK